MTTFTATGSGRRIIHTLLFCCMAVAARAYAADLQDFTGDPAAPPLALDDLHGNQHTLEDYRGRVVMVNFWAGWCHPCIQEIPELLKLTELLADRPFAMLAVNVGEERHKLAGFVKKMDEHMVVLMDTDSQAFKRWQGIGLPSTFILDPAGQIRYEAYGPVNWDAPWIVAMIEELMEQPAASTK
jgi:thiol-disulfide isomerase/thioredoxin